jgi:S-methylmethionine-dependent homocysteine/selenocysteine methylase
MRRNDLPQLDGGTFITDGGMETTLISQKGLELPEFASFVLLDSADGIAALRDYYAPYVDIARERGVGILLDTPTWRANADWGERLGYSPEAPADVNRRSVALLEELRSELGGDPPLVISGCVGPRGDGYRADERMSAADAQAYHLPQVATFADTRADLVSALTLTYADEATGVVRAAQGVGMPVVISFTVETDGRLPSGQSLAEAIAEVDAQTDRGAAYFMINCAHPTHFEHVLDESNSVADRIRGLRANASTKSHAELDESDELDAGDPVDLAARYARLRGILPRLNVVGGCCGTDERHVAEICRTFIA